MDVELFPDIEPFEYDAEEYSNTVKKIRENR